jgi:hypothetical protein
MTVTPLELTPLVTRPGLTGIAARIVAGEPICPGEVRAHNAARLVAASRYIASGAAEHPAKGCRDKDCIDHGDRTRTPIAFAAVLANEARECCTCGRHR